jgi:hypothetical protein
VTSGQELVFAVLWLCVLFLIGLVLVLYREVDRAYSAESSVKSAGLLSGTPLPDLEIVDGTQVTLLPKLRSDDPVEIVFIKRSCVRCETLVGEFSPSSADPGVRTVIVVLEGETPKVRASLSPAVEVYEPAFPIETARDFGVSMVPLAYFAKGGRVIATGSPSSRAELTSLLPSDLAPLSKTETP